VLDLAHPDLCWYFPLEPGRKAGDADKQVDLVEEALGEELARRREEPFYEAPAGTASHSIATVRLLLRRLALTPVLGGWRVVIVGDADRLTSQLASPEAANAMLKVLEEPPRQTVVVLTSSEPGALLRTILSRVVRLRVGLLRDSVVTLFAQNELAGRKKVPKTPADVAAAAGRIGRLLAPIGPASEPAAAAFLAASRQDAVARYGSALRQTPYQARGGFTGMLDALLERLRAETRAGGDTEKLVEAIARVREAREAAQGNVNPQLLAAVLADEMAAGD
jgi:DNA polymerase-3 subunit delta'